jgi:hypothetical protein
MKIYCKKIQDKEFFYIILKTDLSGNTLYIRLNARKSLRIEACIRVKEPLD